MINTVFKNSSPFFRLIFTGLIMVLSFILIFIIGILAIRPFMSFSFADIQDVYSNLTTPFNINLLKYIQALSTLGLFVVPPFIVAKIFYGHATKPLWLKNKISGRTIVAVVLIMIFALPVINFTAELNSHLKLPEFLKGLEEAMRRAEDNAQFISDIFVNVSSFPAFLFNVVVIAFLPAIGEEVIFRGVFQRYFIEWTKSVHTGVFLAAILFSAFHFQFFGFIPRMLMGILFGYLVIWTKSVWISIIAHFVNNVTAVTFYYLYNIKVINVDVENIGADNTFYILLPSLIILVALIYFIYKNYHPKEERMIYDE